MQRKLSLQECIQSDYYKKTLDNIQYNRHYEAVRQLKLEKTKMKKLQALKTVNSTDIREISLDGARCLWWLRFEKRMFSGWKEK